METENMSLKDQVSGCQNQIQQMKVEAKDMMLVRDELDKKLISAKKVWFIF